MFSFIVILLCITAIALVVYPLLRRTDDAGPEQEMLHAAVLASQRRELEQDLAEGLIDEEQFQRAQAELARETPEARATGRKSPRAGRSLATAAAVAIFLPAIASAIYDEVGTAPSAVQNARSMGMGMEADFGEMIAGLQARLDANPDDPAGWALLARSYFSIGRPEQALAAYRRALERGVENASLYAQYADLLASRQQGFAGEPDRLLERALKLEPDNAHALWLAATSAQDKGALDRALAHWEHLSRVLDPSSEEAAAVAENLRATRERLNAGR
ncbi:MAG: c-type cytochrome biogenesis protein CcmI [Thiohalomonadaceae bacterium]